jgi:hypothetical protein
MQELGNWRDRMKNVRISELEKDVVFNWLRCHYDEDVLDAIYVEAEEKILGDEMHDAAIKFAERDIRRQMAGKE